MFSLIRDVLIPGAPALLLIGSLVASNASAQARPDAGTPAPITATAALGQPAVSGVEQLRPREPHHSATADDLLAQETDKPRCRRVERIGKYAIRRCK